MGITAKLLKPRNKNDKTALNTQSVIGKEIQIARAEIT